MRFLTLLSIHFRMFYSCSFHFYLHKFLNFFAVILLFTMQICIITTSTWLKYSYLLLIFPSFLTQIIICQHQKFLYFLNWRIILHPLEKLLPFVFIYDYDYEYNSMPWGLFCVILLHILNIFSHLFPISCYEYFMSEKNCLW